MKKVYNWLVTIFQLLPGGGKILDSYILSQLFPAFLFGVGLLSTLGVAIGNLSDLANKVSDANLPILIAVEILLLKVPEFVSYALPVSVLLATLTTYGRLSNDSEIIAIRSCGTNLFRLIVPAFLLSLMVTGLTFICTELVVPSANYRATSLLITSIKEEHEFRQTKDIFYPDYENIILPDGQTIRTLRSLFYAEQFNGKEMKYLTILQWVEQRLGQIVISDSASWNALKNTWDFFDGTIYQIAPDASYSEAFPFEHQQLKFPRTVFDFASQGRNPYEMNIAQAQEYTKILKLSGDQKKVRLFKVRLQQKIAFPFVCIVFGIVGSAIGSGFEQIGRGTSFGLSVGIVFAYYVLGFMTGSMGIVGAISPFLSAWLPNILGLILGIVLVHERNK
ncbi:LptF/LptG family permease [Chroococcus sp. FPU101]|uniref:LptF/LptG family permease n=1 Tax=Chroococcus sp. FPU101 TaxID=1974212 RepID=UPI001A8F156D|nr:LptF/LptG family permease [Chroococcus sp. FPU101]GFE69340.1 putative permease YjgP/YjgQ [Chroococcus sp. FPU101]